MESGDTRTLPLLPPEVSFAETFLNSSIEKSVTALQNASSALLFPAGFLV